MAEEENNCRQIIISENTADFFLQHSGQSIEELKQRSNSDCIQIVNNKYAIEHFNINDVSAIQAYNTSYSTIPKCFGLMDSTNMESIGVKRLRRQPYLNLLGSGVLIGIVDTGIDYQNPLFQYADGTTRIYSIWDQNIQTGNLPEGFVYGSEYTKEEINEALRQENPLDTVPSTDTNGHGTFMAGIAAGNIDEENDFTGVAPLSELVIVKMKPAKQYLRDYFYIREDATVYQETDIVMGVKYLINVAQRVKRPLVICLGVGTNSGGHDGTGILDEVLSRFADNAGTCFVCPTGNEANSSGHYRSQNMTEEYEDVELRVGENERGFALEFWASAPSKYSIAFVSPTGELIERVPARVNNSQVIRFLFENTVIYLDYRVLEIRTGDELIFMRFENPSAGIWKLRIYKDLSFSGPFDMWLPIREFIGSDTYFIRPDPDVTITAPGNSEGVITTGAYNHTNNSIYISSGRGYTRKGMIKPDIVAPGVNIYGPVLNQQFGVRSGTSIAAAHTAGVAALLLEWGAVKENQIYIDTNEIKKLMIRGASRGEIQYPNREWGYGRLDVYGVLDSLRSTL
ncbi:MAG: peptidase [Lachnospiraceae bacterium]|nr:peptidase [Lachnospiraceae bacterium]